MIAIVIKVIIGLFIWMVLPQLIFRKKSKKKAPYRQFTSTVCLIIGVLILFYAGMDLVKFLFYFK